MMVMTMTMMLNADKMTISGRAWSLRGQGGGEGGSRLTFRLMAVVMVAMVVGVTMMVIPLSHLFCFAILTFNNTLPSAQVGSLV